jgi:hypothetical protein
VKLAIFVPWVLGFLFVLGSAGQTQQADQQETGAAAISAMTEASAIVEVGLADWEERAEIDLSPAAKAQVKHAVLSTLPNQPSEAARAADLYLFEIKDRLEWARSAQVNKIGESDLILPFNKSQVALALRKKPRAYLSISSEPDGAAIEIDREGRGSTYSEFVVSPGTHAVRVFLQGTLRKCEETVQVEADQTVPVHCKLK